ncbi:MAG: NAD(P)H-hydrate dehydratase [Alphaproteobacteria bacterium]|nr:NAD(P)H-hydrate dehydratase [Alphaproteobacteria bacterium]
MKKRAKVKENAPGDWSIPPLRPEDNKYTRGHVLILGGSTLTGASKLAARAAQRAGAGMVTLATTAAAWPVYAAAMESALVRPCTSKEWAALVADARISAVLIGPGAGLQARTKSAIRAAAKAGKTLILDADALTLLAGDAPLRQTMASSPMILTPHAGEYARLAAALGLNPAGDKAARARALARAMKAVVVLKGSETIVADGQGKLLITRPPAWLASAGTGDVLAGIIAALVAQGMTVFEAASAGVWLHAAAARAHGPGMIAEDVIVSIPAALRAALA